MVKLSGADRPGSGLRLYKSSGDRRKAVAMLKKDGANYFIGFHDPHPRLPFGLSYGREGWVGLVPYERGL